jgi:hypothetical protein
LLAICAPSSTIAAFPLPRFFCRTIDGKTVNMHSSGENGRKRKDNSDKKGEYQKFDEFSSRMRDSVIKLYAKKSLLMLLLTMEASNDASSKIWSTWLLKLYRH